MGLFGRLVKSWYESGGIRFQHGTRVCIQGEYEVSSEYAGLCGSVVGLGQREHYSSSLSFYKRFLVDLGGMQVEVPPDDLELERGYAPKGVPSSEWEG